MSKHVRSRSVWEVVLRDEESSEPVGPVLVSALLFRVFSYQTCISWKSSWTTLDAVKNVSVWLRGREHRSRRIPCWHWVEMQPMPSFSCLFPTDCAHPAQRRVKSLLRSLWGAPLGVATVGEESVHQEWEYRITFLNVLRVIYDYSVCLHRWHVLTWILSFAHMHTPLGPATQWWTTSTRGGTKSESGDYTWSRQWRWKSTWGSRWGERARNACGGRGVDVPPVLWHTGTVDRNHSKASQTFRAHGLKMWT